MPLEEHTLIHGVRIKPLEQHTLIREPELVRIPLLETTHRDRLNAFRAAHPDSGEPELVLIPLLGPNQGDRIKPLEEHTLIHRVRIKPHEEHP